MSKVNSRLRLESCEGVSVVICCYNSASRIRPVLEHIARQQLPVEYAMEIILVDNNSNDDTVETASTCWMKTGSQFEFRIVPELQQGLSYARYRGCIEAKYPVIIFCDDDNWIYSNYAAMVLHFFQEHPKAAIVGGIPTAVADSSLPEWFASRQELFACGQMHTAGRLEPGQYVFGAGMAVRRLAILQFMDPQFPMLCKDRTGKELTSGGDFEICLRAAIAGDEIWLDERLRLSHYIPGHKLKQEYVQELFDGLPVHTWFLRKYAIYIEVMNKTIWQKAVGLVYNASKYVWARLRKDQFRIAWAADYLFCLSGISWFGNEPLRVIAAFASKSQQSVKNDH